jgi:hypothetical protein
MKRIPFPVREIIDNFTRPHSKAEEPDHLFRQKPPPIIITIQSPREGERLVGYELNSNSCRFMRNKIEEGL